MKIFSKKLTKDDLADLININKLKSIVDKPFGLVRSRKEILQQKKEKTDMKKFIKGLLIFVGVVAVICGVAYALYRYFTPDYDDAFDDDFDDSFDDDDLFEDDADTEKA
ncbi:MAG: hypothetical protein DUD27_04080 [Lachnospiraceae bacterium]|uniref:DUF4366 domain-containing protein n=1 Tax=Candidatus Weimeria bifida TaxID=2599074 RepID=A0A6N7IZN6_9FIRM|nr:hypothetical protein [Candidatus Weimeria bifida]RRF96523.1 MAG: hypothetical protein DUD27_04080 [Lachnospiraceae bacterium]